MENLQIISANMIRENETGAAMDDPYSAIGWVENLPPDFSPRQTFFKTITLPVRTLEYTYLVGWLDNTPPHPVYFKPIENLDIEPDLMTLMQSGAVVGYRQTWRGELWSLEIA